ncbi:MAG: SPASM domain-containing protein, partial [Spirochaetaceae bacterium]|nr:SPASM domain-containing protein [Spirochaetaceae bacterium]
MIGSIYLFITEECNLTCKYCFNDDSLQQTKEVLELSDFKVMFKNLIEYNKLYNNNKITIHFFGGEPTIHLDLIESIIDYVLSFEKIMSSFFLFTNGILLYRNTDTFIRIHKKSNLRIQLSVDSDPSIDSERTFRFGKEKYEKSINNTIDFLINNKIRFTIRATLPQARIKNFYQNYKYFFELTKKHKDILSNFDFYPDHVTSIWSDSDIEILKEEINKIVQHQYNEYKNNNKLISDSFFRLALKQFGINNGIISIKSARNARVCGFCHKLVAVGTNGDIYACHRVYKIDKMKVGNLIDNDINIQKKESISSVLNNRTFIKPHYNLKYSSCNECIIKETCKAVCPANSFYTSQEREKFECIFIVHNI